MEFNIELVNQQIWGLVRFLRSEKMDQHEANTVRAALANGGGKLIADLCRDAGEAGKLMAAVHYASQIAAERDALQAELAALKAAQSSLFDAIKHGDQDHQDWLRDAIDRHFASTTTGAKS